MNKIENAVVEYGARAMVYCTRCVQCAENAISEIAGTKAGKLALTAVPMINALAVTASAEGGEASSSANEVLSSIMGVLKPGVIALGTLVTVIGGIQLGKGFTRDDADAKSTGMMTMIGGVIIAGVGAVIPEDLSISGN